MNAEERSRLIDDITRLERELHQKRSQIAADDLGNNGRENLDTEALKAQLRQLIEAVGRSSTGGNSVEDIRAVRRG